MHWSRKERVREISKFAWGGSKAFLGVNLLWKFIRVTKGGGFWNFPTLLPLKIHAYIQLGINPEKNTTWLVWGRTHLPTQLSPWPLCEWSGLGLGPYLLLNEYAFNLFYCPVVVLLTMTNHQSNPDKEENISNILLLPELFSFIIPIF